MTSRPPMWLGPACLRAAAQGVRHFVAGNVMRLAEFLKLLEVEFFGHFLQRVVSRLPVPEATQDFNQPLPCVRHSNLSAEGAHDLTASRDIASSEREAKRFGARLQQLDFEPAVANWLRLADQLIHPLLD